ncbi:hypothetical protein K0M31_005249 [Melipona bicolor]|uniref:Myosin motor domain-containing protein n=1 Tax=Melipona bicolor TaxID=60889 RepID=A0AA40KM90_9HYME|nr:hypothetical protein K0M31_005249 [Melipona bicolor]
MQTTIKQSISPSEWDFINDLSALPEDKDVIIDFLLQRLQQKSQIYTWVGSLLLTLNPNNEVSTSDLYNSSEFDKHVNTSEASPHIFAIAAKAHYNLIKEIGRTSQVIIISGETGTGKTFNAYKCLDFLSNINKKSVQLSQGDCAFNIMLRITDACHLISIFTTACTEKNEVSSRHGQLIKLHYKSGIISGATINSFLLERSRVTRGANNFQIFYQMIFGMSSAELESFYLSKDKYYDILNITDYNKRKYFEESFQDTLKALDALDFKLHQKSDIFQVLALLIHMGNIKFKEDDEICVIDFNNNKSKEAMKNICDLSSLTEESIMELLTTVLINPQSIWRKHTSYHRHLVTIDACRNRLHSIIRHMYDLLFHWILNHANKTLSLKQQYSQWLGILDIFGFECFTKNGIEQLCVNYANERIQQYFIKTYVENNCNNLQEEGLVESCVVPLHTINLYKERLNIIEENLFLTLSDVCQSPVVIDTSTMIQLACKNLHDTQRKFLRVKEENFVIEHYSRPVAYSIDDLMSKNTDKVPNEISLIFSASKNKFLRSLINFGEEQYLHIVKASTTKKTMLAKLKYNMDTLIKELSKCDLHYVRCVKPNRSINNEWDRKDFQKQLACIGIFDALPLAKCKYPFRLSYQDFCCRYFRKPTETIDLDKCRLIMESVASKKNLQTQVHFGKQMIFLTEFFFLKLESYRRNYRIRYANKIKASWIRYKHRKLATSKYLINSSEQRVHITNKDDTVVKITLDQELTNSNTSDENDVFVASFISQNNNEISYSNIVIENEDNENIGTNEDLNKTYSENENEYENNWTKILGVLEKDKVVAIEMDSSLLFYRNRILSRRWLAAIPIRMHTRTTCMTKSHVLPRSVLPQGLQDCLTERI